MEVFTATMDNYQTAIDATNTALNSQGSAQKENAKAMDSLKGKLSQLQTAWENFSRKMVTSDIVSGILTGLTGILDFLSSDLGQATIKMLAFATAGSLAFKGISKFVGVFSNIAKTGKGAVEIFTALRKPMVVSSETGAKALGIFTQISKIFGTSAGFTGGVLGLATAFGALNAALVENVDIGASKESKQADKDYEKLTNDIKDYTQKIRENNEEIEELQAKVDAGTATVAEEARLEILKDQTEEYKRQLNLKKQLTFDSAVEKYSKVDPNDLTGSQKSTYTTLKSAGKSDKEALAAAGATNDLAVATSQYRDEVNKVTTAQNKYRESVQNTEDAYTKYGKKSQEYKDAIKNETEAYDNLQKAQEKSGKSLDELKKLQETFLNDIGGKGNLKDLPKSLRDSYRELESLITALESLQGISFDNVDGAIATFKSLGDSIGIAVNKAGNINKIDLSTFESTMSQAGFSVEKTWQWLQKIGESNPKAKITIDGTQYTIDELDLINGKIQSVNEHKAHVEAVADTTKAEKDLDVLDQRQMANKQFGVNVQDNASSSLRNINTLANSVARKRTIVFEAIATGVEAVKSVVSKVGYAKGTRNASEGFAEVNEQGWEFIRDKKTNQLRVANGGDRTVTYLNKGDQVYTHQESKGMLSTLKDIVLGGFASGSQDRNMSNWISQVKYGKRSVSSAQSQFSSYKSKGIIDAEEYYDKMEDVYNAYIEFNMDLYQNDKKTYKDMKALLDDYYNKNLISAEDYYSTLEDLADEQLDKEKDRLEKQLKNQENQYDLAKMYVQQQIDLIERQSEKQEEANELLELQNKLADARNQKVKIYKEGEGWVYEQDVNAFKEAQDALNEFNKTQATKPWEDILDLFDRLETLSDIKDLENKLGISSDELVGGLGTDLIKWEEWIKNNLSTSMGLEDVIESLDNVKGYEDILKFLGATGSISQSVIDEAIKNNKFANGTLYAKGGLSMVGENGYELAMLGIGDAVLPHHISKNLMDIGRYSSLQWRNIVKSSDEKGVQYFSWDKIILPNVSNANQFMEEIRRLPNQAIQSSSRR